MSVLPPALISSLHGIKGFDKAAFEQVHAAGEQVTSVRLNPLKLKDGAALPLLHDAQPVPWSAYGYYLPQRPSFTFDPLFHAGCYYVQEASSMFLEQALLQTTDLSKPLRVLDLSAAPGGKSTHIQSLLSADSLLVSNEVIRSRAAILKDNMIKWGGMNVAVTSNDPNDFAKLENYFDVIVADAPCSGSGLFRKDPLAIQEWSEDNVTLCARRQQRILAGAWPALKKNGVLIYSTCSYSQQEDEEIAAWMQQEMGAEALTLTIPEHWGITATGNGYRFWPYRLKGEGFFIACFRKKDGAEAGAGKIKKAPLLLSAAERQLLDKWIHKEDMRLIRHEQTVYAWPEPLVNDLSWLLQQLHVLYSGVMLGELMRDKLVPGHALAMSRSLLNESLPAMVLNRDDAIRYLQRKDISAIPGHKGWQLAAYGGHCLGWINALPNRINNYYPKSLRILKEEENPAGSFE
ncbi:MAG TPA: RsmF rRNA methyltransferase first C-terminal domain-containing protein [Chitinophagaceae bacterium]|nr:RsmF rRNA methyltransferase first C-terminal domain-containing protein [Chitinophagaceae bacterium]